MRLVLIKFLRCLGVEILSTARVQKAVEPVVPVFFVPSNFAVRLVAPTVGLVVPAPPLLVAILLASLVTTLVVAVVALVFPLTPLILVGLPRFLDVPWDVIPTLHLVCDFFHVKGVRRIERINILVVGEPVLHALWKNIPKGVFEVVSRQKRVTLRVMHIRARDFANSLEADQNPGGFFHLP